ncbi:MAG: hypothetical protein KatS3mg057_2798 [Herpetosiphonaceae bacterium]|nr:MAG: hypothetical protein KatS3mg057_2798 [Herpetosiphonaceae bacterium]
MSSLQEQLNVLRRSYALQIQERVQQLEMLSRDIKTGVAGDHVLHEIHMQAHRLAGSAASFGFQEPGRVARRLELYVRPLLEAGLVDEDQHQEIESCLHALREAVEKDLALFRDQGFSAEQQTEELLHQDHSRRICLLDTEPESMHDIVPQLEAFGYTVRTYSDLNALRQGVAQEPPAALILKLIAPEDTSLVAQTIREIQQGRELPLPVIFISSRDDIDARLQAVRAGCDAYFTMPPDFGALIDKLDSITAISPAEPIRILIVDDEPILAAAYALVLQRAGMLTEIVSDPLVVLESLNEFRPDLILMDLYMPNCTGLELAAVIRQQPAYVGIPIVFLSAETDFDKQLAAMQMGGDDFLTKTIQPDQLVSAVTSRAQRSIVLRSLMTTDSLTGLLNHTSFKERLALELARAQRLSTPLAFALIDIDHFKSVNDTYGHPTGDRVLRSLARLLTQRLRKTDAVGRYGGEEFGVILPSTTGAMAFKILHELHIGFARIRHPSERGDFSVTFSCGIATFPEYQDAISLNDAADKALYEAKRRGRDQVVLSIPI